MVTFFLVLTYKMSLNGVKASNLQQFKNHNNYFSDLKRIMMVKEIPRNGVVWYIEIEPNDLLILERSV